MVLQIDFLIIEEGFDDSVFNVLEAGVDIGVLELRKGELDVLRGHNVKRLGVVLFHEQHFVEEDELIPTIQDRTI